MDHKFTVEALKWAWIADPELGALSHPMWKGLTEDEIINEMRDYAKQKVLWYPTIALMNGFGWRIVSKICEDLETKKVVESLYIFGGQAS